jgi:hypothetical protein
MEKLKIINRHTDPQATIAKGVFTWPTFSLEMFLLLVMNLKSNECK